MDVRLAILLGLSSSTSVVGDFFFVYLSLSCFVPVDNDNLKCGGVLINKVVQHLLHKYIYNKEASIEWDHIWPYNA